MMNDLKKMIYETIEDNTTGEIDENTGLAFVNVGALVADVIANIDEGVWSVKATPAASEGRDYGKMMQPPVDATHCGGYPVNPPASDPRLEEWERRLNAAITVGPIYRDQWERNAAIAKIAREAIPQLIAMVRDRDAKLSVKLSAETEDLIEALTDGVKACGLHEDNDTELFLIEDANDTMADAATALRAAFARAKAAEARVRELEKIIEKACAAIHEVHSGDMSAYEVMDILTRAET
jgi:hypothetical protein